MAYFKITLLTPYSASKTVESTDFYDSYFLEDVITDFSPQLNDKENTTTFTYNEQVSFSQNSQRTLTFSMNKHIIRQDEVLENPFVNLIQTGTQLLLTDQYHNEYFFTVNNIKYNIKETNIVYEVSCQDSFSYQTSRQNQNYSIYNDITSEDFIGAKTADWWIVYKVVPECHLTNYQYVPCSRAVYEANDGSYKICDNLEGKTDVKRIIKEPHAFTEEGYYTTFAYSCSGMSADSVLIDIASKINMQVRVFEHAQIIDGQRTKYFDRYFWLEPIKNERRTGLVYSPRRDIQSFDLSHNGTSLTTVLNVNGPTYDDEIITLLPDIPLFFNNYFIRPDWDIIDYSEGLFTQACSGQLFINSSSDSLDNIKERKSHFMLDSTAEYKSNFSDIDGTTYNGIFIRIYDDSNLLLSKLSNIYNHLSFIKDNYISEIGFKYDIEGGSKDIYSKPTADNWVLVQPAEDDKYKIFSPGNNFDNQWDSTEPIYLVILHTLSDILPDTNIDIFYHEVYLYFYRDTSEEELEFATVADKCPWLENKLIDFTYFKNQNIISAKEYNQLINILYNDLRKVNGHLMYYSRAYYKALHDKTEMIANLTNQLDSLGAACQAAVVDPLATTGKVKDISYFVEAYNEVFNNGTSELMNLIDYDLIVTDYFTKYFNAQQRFLKNIYNFREYFYSENPLEAKGLYNYTIHIQQPEEENPVVFYGFSENKFININSADHPYIYYVGYGSENENIPNYGKPFLPIYQNQNGKIYPVTVASADKWHNHELYRYPTLDQSKYCSTNNYNISYNNEKQYLKTVFKIPINKDDKGYYWDNATYALNNKRYIGTFSNCNYLVEDEVNLTSQKTLQGLYLITFNTPQEQSVSVRVLCKATHTEKNNNQYYIYLEPIHQGKYWVNNSNTEQYYHIFNENFSLETSEFVTLDNVEISSATLVTPDHIYRNSNFIQGELVGNEIYTFSNSAQVGLQPAEILDITNNWYFKHWDDTSKCFAKTTPVYYHIYRPGTSVSLKRAFETLTSFAPYNLFWMAAGDDKIADKTDLEDFYNGTIFTPENGGNLFAYLCSTFYTEQFPVTDFYVKGPRFRTSVSSASDISGMSSKNYIFERLNSSNQSLQDYLKYYFNTGDYSATKVENPYAYTEYKKLNLVNKDNESRYYRRVIEHPNAGWATSLGVAAAGVFIFGPAAPWTIPAWIGLATIAGATADILSETQQTWATKGTSTRDFWGARLARGKRFSGYRPSEYAGKLIYATTEQSYGQVMEQLNAYKRGLELSSTLTKTLTKYEDWTPSYSYVPWTQIKQDETNPQALVLSADSKTSTVTIAGVKVNIPVPGSQYYSIISDKVAYDIQTLFNTANSEFDVCFIDKKVYPLTLNEEIHANDSIYLLWISTSDITKSPIIYNETKAETFFTNNNSFSATMYWPLVSQMIKVNTSNFEWSNQSTYSLREMIESRFNILPSSGNYLIHVAGKENGDRNSNLNQITNGIIALFRIEGFDKKTLKDTLKYPDNIQVSLPRLFDSHTKNDFDVLAEKDAVEGFYEAIDITSDLVDAQSREQAYSSESIYYTQDGNRIYSIQQLKDNSNLYVYLRCFDHEEQQVGDKWQSFNIKLSKYTIEYDTNGVIINVAEEPLTDIYKIKELEWNDPDSSHHLAWAQKTLRINDDISITLNFESSLESNIQGLSNGTFWALYHSNINLPILFSVAATIEAQLTEYWNQAYYASKMCEYFLPESWTPTSNQLTNNFSTAIWTLIDTDGVVEAKLFDNFLPHVQIFKNNYGESLLKKYKLSYIVQDIEHQTAEVPNQNYVWENQNKDSISPTAILMNNLAYRNAFEQVYQNSSSNVINDVRKWNVTEIGKTTYYYANTGGTTWQELIQGNIANSSFEMFSGWYIMALRWLKAHYQNWKLEEYVKAKKAHDAIWDKIYKNYGHILLENNFTSKTATTSTELLKEALLYFKDKQLPERAYNITIIDAASLDNYTGAEIQVGDGIQVKANDYYNEYDSLYESLTQYLFITDIKYTLRSATNIALTVNSIKYADTIVKRLAKLIK